MNPFDGMVSYFCAKLTNHPNERVLGSEVQGHSRASIIWCDVVGYGWGGNVDED